jgi:hypothetical protein
MHNKHNETERQNEDKIKHPRRPMNDRGVVGDQAKAQGVPIPTGTQDDASALPDEELHARGEFNVVGDSELELEDMDDWDEDI